MLITKCMSCGVGNLLDCYVVVTILDIRSIYNKVIINTYALLKVAPIEGICDHILHSVM